MLGVRRRGTGSLHGGRRGGGVGSGTAKGMPHQLAGWSSRDLGDEIVPHLGLCSTADGGEVAAGIATTGECSIGAHAGVTTSGALERDVGLAHTWNSTTPVLPRAVRDDTHTDSSARAAEHPVKEEAPCLLHHKQVGLGGVLVC